MLSRNLKLGRDMNERIGVKLKIHVTFALTTSIPHLAGSQKSPDIRISYDLPAHPVTSNPLGIFLSFTSDSDSVRTDLHKHGGQDIGGYHRMQEVRRLHVVLHMYINADDDRDA
jgi:hypothetical protein